MKQDLAAAGLLHDWNNVLQTVTQAAALLADDPQWAPLAHTLEAAALRGRAIAESLTEEPCTCDLRDIIDRAAAGSSIRLNADLDGLCSTHGRPRALERVFINLLENSAAAGASSVFISGTAATLTIHDDGPGIPQDLLPRLFEPGVSGRGSTGLGLHIVGSIIQAHGGTITAENHPAGGACFRICLPEKP
ncbi:hypothetical protein F183_A05710 [Bryobacterales bacterium F-183]|nr:hypothetical protein F183_A05710 [Bryobacterales bacterium F-183]